MKNAKRILKIGFIIHNKGIMTELEKAADKFAEKDAVFNISYYKYEAFIAGAKWAEENSEKKFIKEDMLKSWDAGYGRGSGCDTRIFNNWFKENYEK